MVVGDPTAITHMNAEGWMILSPVHLWLVARDWRVYYSKATAKQLNTFLMSAFGSCGGTYVKDAL